ncbi:MAG: Ger(x)C family spore germination protein [Clostridium sp.]|uniref:Ger(x)C family spore germination protein n=1 Tax=Clostridium sp. TaxID=1506 RepID=UPI003F3D8674
MRIGKRKIRIIAIILLMSSCMTGCYNYKEISTVTFATSLIFDVDNLGNIIIYMDCVRPYRNTNESSDNGKRIIYKGNGKTALEAIRDINLASSYKLNLTQNRAIIFTEAAAKAGIDKFLNFVNNDQEAQAKPYIFIFFGDVASLLDVTSNDEEYLGLFLDDLVHKNRTSARGITTNINDYLSTIEIGRNSALIGGLRLRKDVVDQRVELSGAVLMQDNKMAEVIDVQDSMSYNFLTNNIKTGTLELSNPQVEEGFITLEVLNSKTRTDIEYDGTRVLLTKKIKTKTILAEAQGRFISSEAAIKKLEIQSEESVSQYLKMFLDKFTQKDLDILEIERLLEIKYPNEVIENVQSKIKFDVDVDINIIGSNKVESSIF